MTAPATEIRDERLPIRALEPLGDPLLDEALAFWFQHHDGAIPDWSVFDPVRQRTLLNNVIIYEKLEGRFFARIVSERLAGYMTWRAEKKFVDEVMSAERAADVIMRLDRCLTDGLPNYVVKPRLWQKDFYAVGYSVLSMPFAGTPDRVMAVFQFHEEHATV